MEDLLLHTASDTTFPCSALFLGGLGVLAFTFASPDEGNATSDAQFKYHPIWVAVVVMPLVKSIIDIDTI